MLDLTVSNPTKVGLLYPTQEVLEAFQAPEMLLYDPEPLGLSGARQALATEFRLDSQSLVLTSSTSEAYSLLLKLLCDVGDEVLVPQPSYPLFDFLAVAEGVRPVPYRLLYDGEWHIDFDSLRRARGPRTRAVVLVSPNNPTGSYLKKSELQTLRQFDLPIIADEVFAAYDFGADPERVESVGHSVDDGLVFALSGLSKYAGLPQMKLAWVAVGGSRALVCQALNHLEFIADHYLSVGAPVQCALPRLLAAGAGIRRSIRQRTGDNLRFLRSKVLPDAPCNLLRVEGGWSATLRLAEVQNDEQWASQLLDRGVMVHPGFFFDAAVPAHVVLSLLPETSLFQQGVEQMLRCIMDVCD